MFEWIAFDADDTLWHNERLYIETQKRFSEMLSEYHDPEWINDRLCQTETSNIEHFGYGIKAFSLSLIETAIELTEERISSKEIQKIINWSKKMLHAEVELLPDVQQVISQLSTQYPLMIITKGDIFDQEAKIKKSGLASYFRRVDIVSEKTPESYKTILKKSNIKPSRFLMVGNSLPSDILPVLEIGGSAVHIPYETTWLHETAEAPRHDHPGYTRLSCIGELPHLLEQLTRNTG